MNIFSLYAVFKKLFILPELISTFSFKHAFSYNENVLLILCIILIFYKKVTKRAKKSTKQILESDSAIKYGTFNYIHGLYQLI